MSRFGWISSFALAALSVACFNPAALAQTEVRGGILQVSQVQELSERRLVISRGTLDQLQVDPNFVGDFQWVASYAEAMLEGYTLVERGGAFPENAGIPREQQITRAQAVYTIFQLENGNDLFLYSSPAEDTASYFIRTPSVIF